MSTPETSGSETATAALPPSQPEPRFAALRPRQRTAALGAALLAAFAIGGGVTAAAIQSRQPALIMLTPTPISSMQDWSAVAAKGEVAEIFGNKFVLQDGSGRALVETGRAGDGGGLVRKGETVTVQGRFEHGFVHAQAISHADGRNEFVGPPGPPPPPHGGPMGPRDPGGPAGPDPR